MTRGDEEDQEIHANQAKSGGAILPSDESLLLIPGRQAGRNSIETEKPES
jgi:hypothetical protein